MIDAIRVIDDFCPEIDTVRQSALNSGFGTWKPNKGEIGSSLYEGMNFWGEHSYMLRSLAIVEQAHILPNAMFFRVTHPGMEAAYVHSDRESGARTCIVYLSQHDVPCGTGFYRHKALGLESMPTFAEMSGDLRFNALKGDMTNPTETSWDQVHSVSGKYNRAVIFHAPLFHSRLPREGIGTGPDDGRMVWVCHYHTPNTLKS